MKAYDVIIIGAGPCGIACGIEAKNAGLSYIILEKGGITDAIRRFPTNMTFFSTPELLEIGDVPFSTANMRPNRAETLQYYRHVVDKYELNLELYTEVVGVAARGERYLVNLENGDELEGTKLIFATGYYDIPNKLGIPGEDLPHVSHYYTEPFAYAKTKVVVVGGQNSAVETALDLFRHGVDVTLVHRGETLGTSVKSWVRPDIENRIKNKEITAYFSTEISEIQEKQLHLSNNQILDADFVLLLTGYRPDMTLLNSLGVTFDQTSLIPSHQETTRETNISGIYVAGSIGCGAETGSIFIENGREHAKNVKAHVKELL